MHDSASIDRCDAGRRAPTLLVFTLGAAGDRARRPLLPGRLAAAELGLRRTWVEEALDAGRAAGCRLAVSSPGRLRMPSDARRIAQRGDGFGPRLAGALDAALGTALDTAAPPAPVVVVGGDSPGLTAGHVAGALAHLAADPDAVVAGPSPDGGFYLLACARPIPGLARGVAWCRGDALATLRRLLAGLGRPLALLPPLADLDRPADLSRWLARAATASGAAWSRLAAAVARLLAELSRPLRPPRLGRPRLAPVPVRAPRGPPAGRRPIR